jgi:hypothetical protein
MTRNLEIIHDKLQKKFYCVIGGIESKVEYDYTNETKKTIEIFHTYVPEQLRGQGIAKEIYLKVIDYIDKNHLKVKPTCSYALKIFSSEKYEKYIE